MKTILFCIVLSLLNSNAWSIDLKSFKSINLQVGNWMENYGQVRASSNDSTNGFEFIPYIAAGLDIEFNSTYSFHPETGWVFQRTVDSISKNIFFFRADVSYLAVDYLKLKLGSSFVITSISGEGGEDKLNNGDSTETYYIPEERSNALNQTLDLGIEIFDEVHGARFNTMIYAWNEDEERMYTYTLSYIYKFDFQALL